jgi:hypothetical protein
VTSNRNQSNHTPVSLGSAFQINSPQIGLQATRKPYDDLNAEELLLSLQKEPSSIQTSTNKIRKKRKIVFTKEELEQKKKRKVKKKAKKKGKDEDLDWNAEEDDLKW